MSADFDALLREYNIDLALWRPRYENIRDQIPFPGDVRVTTGRSNIHGLGLFTRETVLSGQTLAPARIDGRRTPAGRYTNHSDTPNAQMVRRAGDIYLVALTDIETAAEVLVDYRQAYTVGMNE